MEHHFLRDELHDILMKLKMAPRDIRKSSDPLYEELKFQKKPLGKDHIIDLIMQFPKLLERPIVVSDFSAIIGRPPENVVSLI